MWKVNGGGPFLLSLLLSTGPSVGFGFVYKMSIYIIDVYTVEFWLSLTKFLSAIRS